MSREYVIVYDTYRITVRASDAREAWQRHGHVSIFGERIAPENVLVAATGEHVPKSLWR